MCLPHNLLIWKFGHQESHTEFVAYAYINPRPSSQPSPYGQSPQKPKHRKWKKLSCRRPESRSKTHPKARHPGTAATPSFGPTPILLIMGRTPADATAHVTLRKALPVETRSDEKLFRENNEMSGPARCRNFSFRGHICGTRESAISTLDTSEGRQMLDSESSQGQAWEETHPGPDAVHEQPQDEVEHKTQCPWHELGHQTTKSVASTHVSTTALLAPFNMKVRSVMRGYVRNTKLRMTSLPMF